MCSTCKPIVDRMEFRGRADKAAWKKALQRSWDPGSGCFRCHYTGVPLVVDRTKSLHPRYLQREHLVPGDQSRVVAAAAVINLMKGAMTEEEFEASVRELAIRLVDASADPSDAEARLVAARGATSLDSSQLRAFVLALAARFGDAPFDQRVFRLLEPDFVPSEPSAGWLAANTT